MSRRHSAMQRIINPDAKYNSILVARFINYLMVDGKKHLAENIFYKTLNIIANNHNVDNFKIFTDALNNTRPYMKVERVRLGGSNYQVPKPVSDRQGFTFAVRWIIKAARDSSKGRSGTMIQKLAEELLNAANSKGIAFKKKEEMHKMADANKAFAHYGQKNRAKKK